MAKPRNRAVLYPHHVQTRIDPELHHAVESLTPGVTDSTRHRHALRALYELALTSPDCPPALYSTLAAHRPGRWVSLHNTRPDIRPRMTGAELLPPHYAAMVSPAAHHASPYQTPDPVETQAQPLAEYDRMTQRMHRASPYQTPVTLDDLDTAAPIPPQQPGTPEPLNDIAAIFGQPAAPAAPAAPARRPKLDRLGRPVTRQTRPLTEPELALEGRRMTALITAEATGQPLPPFELMPWEQIEYEE